jgi:hypothetical protein
VRLFDLILAGVSVTRLGNALTRPGEVLAGVGHSRATFSIFFGLQVANFDVFLFLVLHVSYLSFVSIRTARVTVRGPFCLLDLSLIKL